MRKVNVEPLDLVSIEDLDPGDVFMWQGTGGRDTGIFMKTDEAVWRHLDLRDGTLVNLPAEKVVRVTGRVILESA